MNPGYDHFPFHFKLHTRVFAYILAHTVVISGSLGRSLNKIAMCRIKTKRKHSPILKQATVQIRLIVGLTSDASAAARQRLGSGSARQRLGSEVRLLFFSMSEGCHNQVTNGNVLIYDSPLVRS